MKFLYLAKRKVLQLIFLRKLLNTDKNLFERIGNDYGFMIIPKGAINNNSNILSFGVGEDIDAEIELLKKYNCKVHLYDPTDISINYIKSTKAKLNNEGNEVIANNIDFNPIALWTEDSTIKFFKPKEANFVSHSINNIDATGEYVEVPCLKMYTIMKGLEVETVDYIKMDIEGAEFEVLDNMLADKIDFKSIYLELHYNSNYSILKNIKNFQKALQSLIDRNYKVIYSDHYRYFCLVKN